MRGHITKRGKDSYTIVLNLGRDTETGKRKQQWVSIKGTKKEAEKRLSELVSQLDNGIYVKPKKTTLTEYLNMWLNEYARNNLSPRGFERYAGIIRKHLIPDIGKVTLTQLKPEHLQKHYTAKLNDGLSARTVRYHHALIHVALQTAVKWGLVSRNVADAVDPPRIRRSEMQTWNENEVNQFLEVTKESLYYSLFYTALFTGMRRSELLALCWQDIDFIYSQIYVNRSLHQLKDGSFVFTQPKSAKSSRTIALTPSTILMLREYQEKQRLERDMSGNPLTDNDLVFSNLEGKPLRPNTITRAWTTLTAKCGLKAIRLHDARHTHASLMLKQGIHPKVVQERLGHSSIQMTIDTYSHVSPGIQESAANRFDEILNRKSETEAIKTSG
ncbi:tyrosine-type recombinase/integrase [Chloroflexota bacterium]